jgi:hypothetical protein
MTPDELELLCRKFRDCMTAEGVYNYCQDRVMNRMLYGDPKGYKPEPDRDETIPLVIPYSEIGPAHPGFVQAGTQVPPPAVTDAEAIYRSLHPFPVEPQPDAPVFGADFREIDPALMADDAPHPLMSACRCGNQIVRQAAEGSWEHC